MRARSAAVAAGLLALTAPAAVRAEPMDPALERLVVDPSCRNEDGSFPPPGHDGMSSCAPDDVAFKKLVNQLGFAFAPSAMHPARTTGYGGIHVSVEAAYTKISNDEDYWKDGTQGPVDAATQLASNRNGNPDGMLQLYSVKLRKGFGFGFEVAGSVGFMPKTSLLGGGADVRFALLEGFRTGVLGIFPDVAVGGGVRTITGSGQLQLTIASLDAQISKPLAVQDSAIITPWIGYQHLWIFGDSGLVDLTPATDAQAYCGYAGSNVPSNPDPAKVVVPPGGGDPEPYYDGQPICTSGPTGHLDFNNNAVFDAARLERHRLLVGFNYQYEVLIAGAQLATDIVAPADAQSSDEDEEDLEHEDRQWSLVLQLGAAF